MPKQRQQPTEQRIEWFRSRIRRWFDSNGRHFRWRNRSASSYEKIVSEVLLQRTRAETIADFFPLFIRAFPSWSALHQASSGELEEFLLPIGLWRRRSISLKNLAKEMTSRRGRFPVDRAEVEELPNVGQYIANAIELFCHNRPRPLLDVNMARVLERFFGPRTLADIRYDPYLQTLASRAVQSNEPAVVNWAILDFAAKVCKPKPDCVACPLRERCAFVRKRSSPDK